MGPAEAAAMQAAAMMGCLRELAASEEAGPAGETQAVVLARSTVEKVWRAVAAVTYVAGQEKQAGVGQRGLAPR